MLTLDTKPRAIVLTMLMLWATSGQMTRADNPDDNRGLLGGLGRAVEENSKRPPKRVPPADKPVVDVEKEAKEPIVAPPKRPSGQANNQRAAGLAQLEKRLQQERQQLARLQNGEPALARSRQALAETEKRLRERQEKSTKEIQRLIDLGNQPGKTMDIDRAVRIYQASAADEKELMKEVTRARGQVQQDERAVGQQSVEQQRERIGQLERQLDQLDPPPTGILPPAKDRSAQGNEEINDVIRRGLEKAEKEKDFFDIDELRRRRTSGKVGPAVDQRAEESLEEFINGLPDSLSKEQKESLVEARKNELEKNRDAAVRAVNRQREAEEHALLKQPDHLKNTIRFSDTWEDSKGGRWTITVRGNRVTVTESNQRRWPGTMSGDGADFLFKPTHINGVVWSNKDTPDVVKWKVVSRPDYTFKGRLDVVSPERLKFIVWGNHHNFDEETLEITKISIADHIHRTETLIPAFRLTELRITEAQAPFAQIDSLPVGGRFCVEARFDRDPPRNRVNISVVNEIDEQTNVTAKRIAYGIYRTDPIRVRDRDRDVDGDVDARHGELIEARYQRKKDGPVKTKSVKVTDRTPQITFETIGGQEIFAVQQNQLFCVRIRLPKGESNPVATIQATFKSNGWLFWGTEDITLKFSETVGSFDQYLSDGLKFAEMGLTISAGEKVNIHHGQGSASVVVALTDLGLAVAQIKLAIAAKEKEYQELLKLLDEAERKGDITGEMATETRKCLKDKLKRTQAVKKLLDLPDSADGGFFEQYLFTNERRFDDYTRLAIGKRFDEFLAGPQAPPFTASNVLGRKTPLLRALQEASQLRRDESLDRIMKMVPIYITEMPLIIDATGLTVGISRLAMAGLSRLEMMGGAGLIARNGWKRGTVLGKPRLGVSPRSPQPPTAGIRGAGNASKAKLRSDVADHIRLRDTTVARSKGIGGAHNLDEFNAAGKAENIRITRTTPHPTQPGVQKIEYQIPAVDSAGKPIGRFKAKVFEKTVYDPKVISDADMVRFGQEAANEASRRGALTREWTGTASNGLRFRGYLDDAGDVRSFFPDF